jgi:glucan phosphoethanolaminetransferase (alkaline phosphatase superfamily)
MIYDSGWALLAFSFGLFVVVPFVAYALASLPIENSHVLPITCVALAGLSVLFGFYVDGQVKRRKRSKHGKG